MFILDFFLGGLMDQFIDWVYSQLVGFFGNFFAEMGNMGVELFEMSWVQSIVLFFSYLAWTLYVVGLVVAVFEVGIEYQTGRASIKDAAISAVKGFMAVGCFTLVPVELYKLSVTLQASLTSGITGYGESFDALSTDIINSLQGVDIGAAASSGVFGGIGSITSPIMVIFIIIMMGYAVIKCFFSNLKRGGVLLIQIAVGSLYMFSVPRGYMDGFVQWCKQIIGLCLTTFLQATILTAGLLVLKDHALLGLGLMLSAGEVPRICGAFGLDTSTRANIMSAVYIRFEQETSKMWPWLISGDEMLAQETTLREIAGRLTAAGEWDTESIYESLTEAFGNNLSLDKQSKDDTKEEERNINIKQDQLDLLWQLEEFRKKHEHQAEPSDWAIRMCEAFVARSMGFTDRVQWTELLRQKGETLFTFDWKSGSVSDHVVQWCKENNRNWRYSHLGELQVAHGGEWRKVDYFCRDGSETRVYFPPEPVQEQQLHALAEAPAVHLRDLLTLGLPDHDVYLVHAAEDVGWVPAADLPRLTAQGKEEFSALLDAKIAAIRPGPYGVELVLDGVNSQLLAQYDETLANSSRAEHAMELFL